MWFVGAMTGTSVDGLDLALLNLPSDLRCSTAATVELPAQLREQLLALASPGQNEIERLGRADVELGQFIAQAVLDFLSSHQITPSEVRAIGSHGQTVRHHPDGVNPFTMQIGNGHTIAEASGIDVVADFRPRDIAAGGQGAPLVPIYHRELFKSPRNNRVVLNVGGIANLTILNSNDESVFGFDTGPGNALLDAWIQHCRKEPFDRNGDWANTGSVEETLLSKFLEDPYYQLPPPKSTGKEHFNLAFVQSTLTSSTPHQETDVQATLLELTARTITQAIDNHADHCQEVIVCGGGRLNGLLMSQLREMNSGRTVQTSEDLGIDGDAIEAAAFAYLAWLFIERMPGNVPSVTGAKGTRLLGCFYPTN